MRTALSFFHLISLACSSFRRSPRSKPSPSPTRSSKPSRRRVRCLQHERSSRSSKKRHRFSASAPFRSISCFVSPELVEFLVLAHRNLRFLVSFPNRIILYRTNRSRFFVAAVFRIFFLVEWERERSIWILEWSSVPDWWGRGLARVLLVMKKKVTVYWHCL